MATRVTIKLDKASLNPALVKAADMSVKRAATAVANRANANTRSKNRVKTGALAQSYKATQDRGAKGRFISSFSVSSPLTYAKWQEEGIGPVYPVRAKVLRFQPKGSSVFIFRPRTRGITGAHQLRDAYKALTLDDFKRA